jgi:3-dehydroshikimate dehydratase
MIKTGVLSVTFRKLAARDIVELAAQAGLHGLEWGGDVHVPRGELFAAREVRGMTEDAGLAVLAYGSYFRCKPCEPFEPVLATAAELGAPLIRIWAGERGSEQADAAYRAGVAEQARHCAALAAQQGIAVAYEFHGDTLTDTLDSTLALLAATPGLLTLWQPPLNLDEGRRLEGLRRLLPWPANVHVFHWRMPDRGRLPLVDGELLWRQRLALAAQCGRSLAAMLEFVRSDEPAQFLQDAAVLQRVVAGL